MDLAYQLVGYAASALIIISLTMTSLLRLRIVGLAGSTLFAVYGVLIGAWPIVITNVVIIGIHCYFLWKALSADTYLSTLEVAPESRYLAEFLAFHDEDIDRHMPTFVGIRDGDLAMLVLRDMEPAGAFVGRKTNGRLDIRLDYVKPEYRDYKLGRHLFGDGARFFRERGYRTLTTPITGVRAHDRYVEKMGFAAREGEYVRELA